VDLLTIEKNKDSLSLKEEVNGKSSLVGFAMKESLQWGGFASQKNVQWGYKYSYLPLYLIVLTSIFFLNNLLWILCILIVLSDAIHYRDFLKFFITATCYITP
jgi:hypothetical protein